MLESPYNFSGQFYLLYQLLGFGGEYSLVAQDHVLVISYLRGQCVPTGFKIHNRQLQRHCSA